jgi:site-specific DNA-methyltransferase (adenine-specific)
LWNEYKRIRKINASIILFGVEPFSSYLRISNISEYRYDWIWKKERPTNPLSVKKNPPRYTENISIFYKHLPTFNPQFIKRKEENKRNNKVLTPYNDITKRTTNSYSELSPSGNNDYIYQPNILEFSTERGLHPTQKPTKLLKFLINTYTNAGSTGVACMNTGRKFIGIEKEEKYFKIAEERIKEASNNLNKFME